jgi:dephospho-CoA kinase
VLRIGLTGGMGSGKTEVARMLAAHGARVIEADAVARELVSPGSSVLDDIVRAFGPGVLDDGGELDRRALARAAFSSEDSVRLLNSITEAPLVDELVRRAFEMERDDPAGVLVIDAALLVQWDVLDLFDVVVAVDSPVETRIGRLVADGFTEEDARRRIASQLPVEELRAAADIVITNDGSMEDLRRAVDRFWRSLPHHSEEDRR